VKGVIIFVLIEFLKILFMRYKPSKKCIVPNCIEDSLPHRRKCRNHFNEDQRKIWNKNKKKYTSNKKNKSRNTYGYRSELRKDPFYKFVW
jgi:hypothetical protein